MARALGRRRARLYLRAVFSLMPAFLAAAANVGSVLKRRKNLRMTLSVHTGQKGWSKTVSPPTEMRPTRYRSTGKNSVVERYQ